MIASIVTALALAAQSSSAPPGAVWTWALYYGDGPIVLANEVPDTAYLRSTLECDPDTGIAMVSIYEMGTAGGFASLKSGDFSSTVETGPSQRGAVQLALRTDHPVFSAFTLSGTLDVAIGEQFRRIEVQRTHLAKLRRFAEVCAT